MDLARAGNLMDWRAAFPVALCFQQLLRGAEYFDLNGSNVVRGMNAFQVVVETSKNHPEGFEFSVPIDRERPSCVGRFMEDYVAKMGIWLGDPRSFFACKVVKTVGVWSSIPSVRVVDSTMRAACKRLIKASGLDPGEYATHSCKRGAALEALKAGLTGPQIQDLGRWSSASMVAGQVLVRRRGIEVGHDRHVQAVAGLGPVADGEGLMSSVWGSCAWSSARVLRLERVWP
jgi:hypothetical protein